MQYSQFYTVLLKYIIVFFLFGLGISQASFGLENIDNGLVGVEGSAEDVVQSWIEVLLGFLYILAVLVGIYGGFQILTAAGDDEKVTKGRNFLIYMVAGLLIIFLAGSIVELVIESILDPSLDPLN